MDHTAPASRITVARYDDDYPLLYGEPAPQPQWRAAKACVRPLPHGAQAGEAAPAGGTSCRSCGRCSRRAVTPD